MVTKTKARACDGKTRHASREAALAAMHSLAQQGGHALARLNVYACPVRGRGEPRHWHVGHRPMGRRR